MQSTQFDATNKKRHILGLLVIATAIHQLGVAVKSQMGPFSLYTNAREGANE